MEISSVIGTYKVQVSGEMKVHQKWLLSVRVDTPGKSVIVGRLSQNFAAPSTIGRKWSLWLSWFTSVTFANSQEKSIWLQ